MASKIVVVGDVNCELREVFTKLARLHAKQNFSLAIVTGDLFGDSSTEEELEQITALLQGNISVPLPTYFTLGSRPLPTRIIEQIEANDEVCSNLYFLGRRSTLKTAEGIRLVALGGSLDKDAKSVEKYQPSYTESDARSLHGAHSADILITHQWPKGIRVRSQVPVLEGVTLPEETQCIADLCSTLKPRYHLSSSDSFFFEREPFFHMPTEDAPDAKPLTRFISLASYSKTSKQKWMYAFSLDPKAAPPLTVPTGATASPLSSIPPKRPIASQQSTFPRFAIDDDNQRPRKRARAPPPGPDQCFFCLSNPNIATHLITSIGNESYLTTAKGPLPTSKTFPSLNFPGHMLIVPFTHTPTLNSIPDEDSRQNTYAEMHRYRTALHSMLTTQSKGSLGSVTWEISRANGIHIHWQFLPVPASLISRGLVTAAFKVEAENLKYPKFISTSPQSTSESGDYFRVWIWDPTATSEESSDADAAAAAAAAEGNESKDVPPSGSQKSILLPLGPEFRFDLQFGRRVMAKLMELEKRINWKDDVQSQAEEEADADAFKEAFKEFDFTLEE